MRALWNAEDLLDATGGAFLPGPDAGNAETFAASGVSIDTRTLQPGDLFVALAGEAGDGHDHVAEALAKGACGALVHRSIASAGRLLLLVDDTLAALTRLGAFARSRFAGRLAAITGSVGKTTTKEMLRAILTAHGPTHAAVASYNNHWGVPLTLARLPPDAAFAVIEIGMNHAGEIEPLARLAAPHVAVVTTIEATHIGHLGSLEAIADEKSAILRGLLGGGVAVLPADSPFFARLAQAAGTARVIGFGVGAQADARLLDAAPDADGTDMIVQVGGLELRLRLAAPGRHMAMNALAALAAAAALGVDPASAAQALAGFAAIAGRGARRLIAVPGGAALLLDESYNASAASVRAALSVLALQPATRRIAVLGDMLELGEYGPAEHASLAAPVAASADLVFTCGRQMQRLFDALPGELRGAHMDSAAELAPIIAAILAPGDAVLVKGSLGSRMRDVVGALDAIARGARQPSRTGTG